jgi:hypothetical protein
MHLIFHWNYDSSYKCIHFFILTPISICHYEMTMNLLIFVQCVGFHLYKLTLCNLDCFIIIILYSKSNTAYRYINTNYKQYMIHYTQYIII